MFHFVADAVIDEDGDLTLRSMIARDSLNDGGFGGDASDDESVVRDMLAPLMHAFDPHSG